MCTYELGFTFIILTYNHEKYIIEHLNSIKANVEKYGEGRVIDLIIADDCSSDNTVCKVEEWLTPNGGLFRKVKRLYSDLNRGTIENLRKAIDTVDTLDFKFLAGDDKYLDSYNIFTMVESINEKEIVVTPVIPFGENCDFGDLVYRFRTLIMSIECKKVKQLIRYDNFIQAPGVFYRGNIFRDNGLWMRLGGFKYIEDIPMWHYFLIEQKKSIRYEVDPYVQYRMGSGVSMPGKHPKRTAYSNELVMIRKKYRLRRFIFPKYINVFLYLGRINRLYLHFKQTRINTEIGDDKRLSVYKSNTALRP